MLIAAGLASFAAFAGELEDGTYLYGDDEALPEAVLALQDCAANARTPSSRRPFADGYIFAIKCASNQENYVETLIFSERMDGKDAWLLLFPGPGGRRDGFEELLPNIRWYPDKNEIGMITVDSDPESRPTPDVCRTDARWRLEGVKRDPRSCFGARHLTATARPVVRSSWKAELHHESRSPDATAMKRGIKPRRLETRDHVLKLGIVRRGRDDDQTRDCYQ